MLMLGRKRESGRYVLRDTFEYTADLSMIARAVQNVVDKIAGSGSVS